MCFTTIGDNYIFFILYLYIRNRENYVFPYVVIENIQLCKDEVEKLDEVVKTDNRIKKLMFYHVKFEEGAVKSFCLSDTVINHLLFVNCTMRNEK